ncbi:hypothetical protein TRFO_28419 [Tritrichomonas foetus]|uniref:Uncharacterized protein n=1 Tax=Tritrichomonas foetus TaxID=1144522 RepID=A0A1J4JYY8_9EUKA|nr:hypothetical protein TRFO_28419 [Tritrichomonas foetus]|eukprot:OHT04187.1 hypothetical protein TRFO_28419 [Tritrichomonas foetus]
MIDPNGFDIWEATIVKIDESDGISVHYPQYPDDDETVKETSRILPKTRINTRIFKEQEKQRQMGEEEEYDLEAQDEEGDDYAPGDGAKE